MLILLQPLNNNRESHAIMTRPHTVNLTSVLPLVFLGMTLNSNAQSLFDSDDVLDVQIVAPLTTFSRVRSDIDYLDGTFGFTDEAGLAQSFDLKMRARGRYRRQKSTCNFPPVRLNFKTAQIEGTIFGGEDKLKLVTHCQNKSPKNEQYVLREYMAYRILRTLTDKSFRTKLLRITYVNNEKNDEPMIKYGFVIEDEDKVGERLGLTALDTIELSYFQLDRKETNLISLFEYLIGNTDYSMIRGPEGEKCCHNSVPFSNGDLVSPVPYDFDFSGLVDAPYAEPNPQLKLRSVRTRLYRGRCENSKHLPDSVAHILSKKAEIYALMDEIPDFDKSSRDSVTKYLDEFFEIVSNENLTEKNLLKRCS